jgi:Flagellar basal body protein
MSGLLDQALDPLAAALKVTGYRQQLLSANIANANTPNYRAVDIPFAQVMQAVQAGGKGSLPLMTNSNRQFLKPAITRAWQLLCNINAAVR